MSLIDLTKLGKKHEEKFEKSQTIPNNLPKPALSNFSHSLYVSRSAIETYRNCPRAYYYNYLHEPSEVEFRGSVPGVVPAKSNVFLEFGSAVHSAIESLDKTCSNLPEAMKAAETYIQEAAKVGWYGIEDNEYAQNYTTKELALLAPAMVFLWAKVEIPYLLKKYSILVKEKPVSKIWQKKDVNATLIAEFRPDMILRDRETGDITTYSLKTLTQWGWREQLEYPIALQVFTEIFGAELFLKNTLEVRPELREKLPDRVRGTRFCFLVKGEREKVYSETGDFSHWVISNPLLRGYKNIMGGSISYAHERKYPKPENKSGWGILGKGWEEFSVIEAKDLGKTPIERLTKWIGLIESSQTIGFKTGKQVITDLVAVPDEYDKDENEVKEVMQGFLGTAYEILEKRIKLNNSPKKEWLLPVLFPKNHGHCFRYGKCQYYEVCHKGSDIDILVADGIFKSRKPHHKEEKKLEGKERG